MSNAFASAGGSIIHRVNLGTGTSFNVSNYPGYKKFTTDNFYFNSVSYTANTGSGERSDGGYLTISGGNTLSKSYDASTGVLTISGTSFNVSEDIFHRVGISGSASANVILVY